MKGQITLFQEKQIKWCDLDGNWHTSFLYLICDKKRHFGILIEENKLRFYEIGRCEGSLEDCQKKIELKNVPKEVRETIKKFKPR